LSINFEWKFWIVSYTPLSLCCKSFNLYSVEIDKEAETAARAKRAAKKYSHEAQFFDIVLTSEVN
jgi:hypothetical protein